MNAPIRNQLLQGHSRGFPANPVEAREQYRRGRLIDDEVDPGEILEGADVAPVAPDDPPLHLIVRQLDQAGGGGAGLGPGQALHGDREDAA
jgi:hypothetical protein